MIQLLATTNGQSLKNKNQITLAAPDPQASAFQSSLP